MILAVLTWSTLILARMILRCMTPLRANSLRIMSLMDRYARGNIRKTEHIAFSLSPNKSTPSALEMSSGTTVFLVVGAFGFAAWPPSERAVRLGLPSGGVSSLRE